ncbi:hypothetical protein D9M73_180270 [compost metagenome]
MAIEDQAGGVGGQRLAYLQLRLQQADLTFQRFDVAIEGGGGGLRRRDIRFMTAGKECALQQHRLVDNARQRGLAGQAPGQQVLVGIVAQALDDAS